MRLEAEALFILVISFSTATLTILLTPTSTFRIFDALSFFCCRCHIARAWDDGKTLSRRRIIDLVPWVLTITFLVMTHKLKVTAGLVWATGDPIVP
jgi:hypothetical protein